MTRRLTAERLRELFHYDPETGIFRTLKRRGRILPGAISGALQKNSKCPHYVRLVITIDRGRYKVHHLAWLYVYGEWPQASLDHIDGDATNNCIGNLREAEHWQNAGNSRMPSTNRSGKKGVSWHSGGKKWQVHIKVNGINMYLGLYANLAEAHAVYAAATVEHRGEFARWE